MDDITLIAFSLAYNAAEQMDPNHPNSQPEASCDTDLSTANVLLRMEIEAKEMERCEKLSEALRDIVPMLPVFDKRGNCIREAAEVLASILVTSIVKEPSGRTPKNLLHFQSGMCWLLEVGGATMEDTAARINDVFKLHGTNIQTSAYTWKTIKNKCQKYSLHLTDSSIYTFKHFKALAVFLKNENIHLAL